MNAYNARFNCNWATVTTARVNRVIALFVNGGGVVKQAYPDSAFNNLVIFEDGTVAAFNRGNDQYSWLTVIVEDDGELRVGRMPEWMFYAGKVNLYQESDDIIKNWNATVAKGFRIKYIFGA